jgi:hypothetical protein
VDPVPAPYFSENLVGLGIEHETSGSVARNSDYQTTEAAQNIYIALINIFLLFN